MADNKIRALAGILASLRGERLERAVIVRAEWSSGHETAGDAACTVLKDRHELVTVCCRTDKEQLLVTMLCGRPKRQNEAAGQSAEAVGNMLFTADAICSFVQAVGDTNRIHQGTCPVIPGMMLMEALLAGLPAGTKTLRIRFLHAAYAGFVAVDWPEGIVSQEGNITSRFLWE